MSRSLPAVEMVRYGDHPSQFAELRRPEVSRGLVVIIHGGFWKAAYGLEFGRAIAEDLAQRGWTTWNLEYRRVGAGGGAPETFEDISSGIDVLASMPELDARSVVTIGHSAGGHLAVWAAARGTHGWPAHVPVSMAISLAGVLDLRAAYDEHLGSGAVEALLGSPFDVVPEQFDPLQQVPLGIPVHCLHGLADDLVPVSQSRTYVEAARAAGATATLHLFDGDHHDVNDPEHESWSRVLALLDPARVEA